MSRVISAFKQFLDGAGDPLIDGWLYFYESGSVSTDKATYSDEAETSANTNPLQLDGEGRCPDVFGTGKYKVVSWSNDPTTDTPAQLIQSKDPVGGDSPDVEFGEWDAASTYGNRAIVTGSDGLYYRSLSSSNTSNDPTVTPAYWEEITFIRTYNANVTYAANDRVLYAGVMYSSVAGANTGNTPSSSSAEWSKELLLTDLSAVFALPAVDASRVTGLDAENMADGSVTNEEFQYLSEVESDIQNQIDNAAFYASYLKCSHTLASGTDGGATVNTTWNVRPINTEDSDPDGIGSISSNKITLQAGTYNVTAYSVMYKGNDNLIRLYNVTDSSTIIVGIVSYSNNTDGGMIANLSGYFTIAVETEVRIDHYSQSGTALTGLGKPASTGENEVYATIEFWKLV